MRTLRANPKDHRTKEQAEVRKTGSLPQKAAITTKTSFLYITMTAKNPHLMWVDNGSELSQ